MDSHMIELLQLPFIQRSLTAAVIAGFLLPLIGNYIVPKKLSLLGDSSSHVAFAAMGVTALLGLGTDFLVYVLPALAIYITLQLTNRFKISGDQALAIMLTIAAAVASLSISFGARVNLSAVLFGSLLFVTVEDVLTSLSVAVATVSFVFINFGKTILYILNEELARIRGINVRLYQFFFAVVAGLSVVTGIKIAGVLLVTALIAVPTAAATLVSRSFRAALTTSIAVGMTATCSGVFLSYYTGVTPGAASVLILGTVLVISAVLRRLGLRI
ncbi:MAG: metal ABC transporter permease [Candidatus Caldarchaeum sp.]